MSFSIKIVDNDTGKVLCDDKQAKCVLGAIGVGDGTRRIQFVKCNTLALYHAVENVQQLLADIEGEYPELVLLAQLKQAMEKRKSGEK